MEALQRTRLLTFRRQVPGWPSVAASTRLNRLSGCRYAESCNDLFADNSQSQRKLHRRGVISRPLENRREPFSEVVPAAVSSVSINSFRWIEAFHRFTRPHTIIGTAIGVMPCVKGVNKSESMESSTDALFSNLDERILVDSSEELANEDSSKNRRMKEPGAFQHLPMVICSRELLGSALRKARIVGPTRGISNIAKRERNKGAKQLDTLTKELATPLRVYIEKFPRKQQLHAYEYSLIDLTFGTGKYEEVLENVNTFRKKILDVGKNYASMCAKSTSKRGAEEVLKEGFSKLEEHFHKHGGVVDELMNVAKILRAMPVFSLKTPTLCLIGAPNVGKSSLVRVLSTGKPEVCNYPFTTRGISMGHIFVQTDVFQVTDTPGLLRRPDDERNNMEKLTLAALSYLPTAVLYVHDLTGECGVKVSDQHLLYKEIKEKFHGRPWLDVVSKADLLVQCSCSSAEMPTDSLEFYKVFGPEGAQHVSVQTGLGIEELKQRALSLLSGSLLDRESCSEAPV